MTKNTMKKYLREWSEDENPAQEFANIVGKGGSLPNKELATWLFKEYGVKRAAELSVKQVMDMLEDHNYHTEYAMLEALKNKKPKAIKGLIAISKVHKIIGHMPTDLMSLRGYLTGSKYWNGIDGKRNVDMILSKEADKIAKKYLDKKQYQEFAGAFRQA